METIQRSVGNGRALAASQPEFVSATSDWPLGNVEPRYIRLKDLGRPPEYCALTVGVDSSLERSRLQLAAPLPRRRWHTIFLKSRVDIAWAILYCGGDAFSRRLGNSKPIYGRLRAVSEHAATIGPKRRIRSPPDSFQPSSRRSSSQSQASRSM